MDYTSHLRKDLQHIANMIPNRSRVLDLGCGDGHLLHYLVHKKNVDGRGIEIQQKSVSQCVKDGLSVIQGDADVDLQFYPDECFDYTISSQMLQATHSPRDVLHEMMRVSKNAIISIPNFGYWYNRFYLMFKGRMPVSNTLSYQWYETPNIHFSTIFDFEALCKDLGYIIKDKIFLSSSGKRIPPLSQAISPNLLSEKCIFVLSKK